MRLFILSLLSLNYVFADGKQEKLVIETDLNTQLTVQITKLNIRNNKHVLPTLLLLGGFHDGADVAEMVQTQHPLMVVSLHYPYNLKPNMNFTQKIQAAPQMKKSIHAMLSNIQTLILALLKRPDVNKKKITIVGGSFGSPFAIQATIEIDDIKGLVLIHGFTDIASTIQRQLYRHWIKQYPHIVASPLAFVASQIMTWYLNYPDLEKQIQTISKEKQILMIVADKDEFIPKHVSQSLWTSIKSSPAKAKQVKVNGSHILRSNSKQTQDTTQIVINWMKSVDLL